MFRDAVTYAKSCPEFAIVPATGRRLKPPHRPIPVFRLFQILGIDVMDLPMTDRGNKHVVVVQDLFTSFAVPDQKAERTARLLADEVVPCFGVPESLLSDRGTNLLSILMTDLCRMLGIKKLNTTAYHPQCDGAVERFNRTLKSVLRTHAARFGSQWDQCLPGILWAYRNTPHSSTGEKPSFLLYGVDCRLPTEAAYLPTSEISSTDVSDYREELMASLSSARELTAKTLQRAQARYKRQYDRHTNQVIRLRVGDWILVRFPQDETGRYRKLSRPWHGPYRIVEKSDTGVVCSKVYFPQDGQVRVHMSRICKCPLDFPAGYFWYGGKRKGPGRPPKWVEKLMRKGAAGNQTGRSSTDGDVTHYALQTPDQSQWQSEHTQMANGNQNTPNSDSALLSDCDDALDNPIDGGVGNPDASHRRLEDTGEHNHPQDAAEAEHNSQLGIQDIRPHRRGYVAPQRHQRFQRVIRPPDRLHVIKSGVRLFLKG